MPINYAKNVLEIPENKTQRKSRIKTKESFYFKNVPKIEGQTPRKSRIKK